MSTPYTADQIRKAGSVDSAKAMVRANLAASDEWLFRGLLALLARQTEDERSCRATRHDNERGFNQSDARYLTWAGQCVEKFNVTPPRERRFSTPMNAFHTQKVRKKLAKYAGQLAKIARRPAVPASV